MSENYTGTKFNTIIESKFHPNQTEKKIILDLIEVGKKLAKLGCIDENGGNFSFKVKRGVIIKTTGSFPHKLKMNDFVLLTKYEKDKVFILGNKEPSSEARLHLEIYKKRADINCILHSHDFVVVKSKQKLNEIAYVKELPYGTLKSAKAASLASLKSDYIVLKNHGVIALAKTTNKAYNLIKKYHEKFKGFSQSST